MLRHAICCALLMGLLLCRATPMAWGQDALDADLRPLLAKYNLPAVAAAVTKNGVIVAAGAMGTRRAGADVPVTVNDRFHIGSDTKAMTALLAAMLIEENKLRWDSTLGEVFSELKDMDAGLQAVTLEQLLSHVSGIPSDNRVFQNLLGRAMLREGNLDEVRFWLVKQWSNQKSEGEPGNKFAYSNMGYVIVGAMIEKVTGKTWDELMYERIFGPLRLSTAGLGCQATLGKIDAPLGHLLKDGKLSPVLAGPRGDNPLVLGPAGIVHLSVLDFAHWAAWNAAEGKRDPQLVKPETMKRLHAMVIAMPSKKNTPPGTPPSGRYGHGWGELTVDWAPKPLLYHAGSNTMNLAHIWIDLERDYGMVLVTNVGGAKADEALNELAPVLYKRYAGAK